MWLGDFHLHSNFSDGKLSIPELVDLFGKRGFGAIAITDHLCEEKTLIGKAAKVLERTLTPATFPIYRELLKSEAERAWKQYRMVVLPGFEVTKNAIGQARSAHILAVGCEEWVSADQDALEIARAIRQAGGLSISSHLVPNGQLTEKKTLHLWNRKEELAPEFDAWEVASGPVIFDEVLRSGLPMIANSDLHHPRQMRSWKTRLECERHPEAILRAIRKQNLSFSFYEEPMALGSAILDRRTG